MEDRNEKRIRAGPNERRPAIGRAPIPVFRGPDIPERIEFCRATVNLLGMNDPKLEEPQGGHSQDQAVAPPDSIPHLVGRAHRRDPSAGRVPTKAPNYRLNVARASVRRKT